jgi:hypothetical protein
MGYMYPTNISTFVVKRIFAKGRITIKECVDIFIAKIMEFDTRIAKTKNDDLRKKLKEKRDDWVLSCAEGEYTDYSMISMGFLEVLCYYQAQGIIEPIIETGAQIEQWMKMKNGGLDTEIDAMAFDAVIPWIFAKDGRVKYLAKAISPISTICL